MNHFCTAAALLGTNVCQNETPISVVEQGFIKHLADYGLSFGTKEEYEFRLGVFSQIDQEIQAANANPDKTAILGHNKFSTWTKEEFKKMLSYNGPQEWEEGTEFAELPEPTLDQVDWRTKNAVTPIKDQGSCGSCWSFSSVAAIEGQYAIKTGNLQSFANQQCVDCDFMSGACNGGKQESCMNSLKYRGLAYEADYPYKGIVGPCQNIQGHARVDRVMKVQAKSYKALFAAIQRGPVSLTLDAANAPFRNYKSGVVTDPYCGTTLNHAVTGVGYGSDGTHVYYIVKNSWGSSWGDNGYIKIAAGPENSGGVCGVQNVSLWAQIFAM